MKFLVRGRYERGRRKGKGVNGFLVSLGAQNLHRAPHRAPVDC